MVTKRLPSYRRCFVCGRDNPIGLAVKPELVENEVVIRFIPGPHHCGFERWVHGGITAALLDEAMFWAAALGLKKMVVTAKLNVSYRKPIAIGTSLLIRAHLTGLRSRAASVHAEVLNEVDRQVHVYADGRYVAIQHKGQSLADFFSDDTEFQDADLSGYDLSVAEPSTQF